MAFGKNSRAYNIVMDVSPLDVYQTEDILQLPSWEESNDSLDLSGFYSDLSTGASALSPLYDGEEDILLRHQLDYTTAKDAVDSLATDLGNVQVSSPVRQGSQKSSRAQLRRAAGEPSRRPVPYAKKTQHDARVKVAKKSSPTSFLDSINEHMKPASSDGGLNSEFSKMNIVASRKLQPSTINLKDRTKVQTGKCLEVKFQSYDEEAGRSNQGAALPVPHMAL